MKQLTFDKGAIKPTLLLDEIIAAGIAPGDVRVEHDDTTVFVTIENDGDETTINTVVTAHDSTGLTVSERRGQENADALVGIRDRYTAFEDKDFLEIVTVIDQWAAGVESRVDGWSESVPQEVKDEIKAMASNVAQFVGPVVAYVYLTQARQYG